MKSLNLNPQNHEVELDADDISHGCAMVNYKLAETRSEVCLTAKEAAAIGAWFTKLAAEIKKREKA